MKKMKDRLFLLERMPKKSICAEIGVWEGNFSQQIIDVVRPKKLHLIDPWLFQPRYKDRWYGGLLAKNQNDMDNLYSSVARKLGGLDSVKIHRMTSFAAAKTFSDEYFDWIHIDGNHSYKYVLGDLDMYFSKIKSGGFITGDDYFFGAMRGFPVQKAVNEFVYKSRIAKFDIENQQFIIQKPS